MSDYVEPVSAVSIIMPTYNEAGNISDLIISSISNIMQAGVNEIEVIVVDDDSPDHTWEIASTINYPPANIRIIRRMKNHGLTASLREGIEAASHNVIVWLDCDFSHPPERIPQMLYMLNQGFDIVVNSRYVVGGGEERIGKGGPIQLLLSVILNWTIRFVLYPSFSDYTSGFVAVRKKVFENIVLRGDYGEYFADFIFRALRKKYRICELPYMAAPRRTGESKTGTNLYQYLRRGSKYLWTVAKLRIQVLMGEI